MVIGYLIIFKRDIINMSKKCLLCILFVFPVLCVNADWIFDPSAKTLTQGSVILSNVSASGTKLTIGDNKTNETVVELDFSTGIADGYVLDKISDNAFRSNQNVTKLVLGDTVTHIGTSAFIECANLTGDLILPDSLLSTGYHPFKSTGITRVVFGAGMKTVNNWFARECKQLESIKWNQNITSIGETAFYYCTELTTFENEFPTNITTIGGSAFYNTPKLEGENRDLKLLKLTGLGGTAFQNSGIKSVELGGGLASTGNAFFLAGKLESVILHEGVQTVGWDCFPYCTSLTNLVIASTVTTVGDCMRNMGNAELHVWWKGIAPVGEITTGSYGLLAGKSTAVHHFDIAKKDGWAAFAVSLADTNVSLTLPPKDSSLSVGSWGYKGAHKVVWYGFPAATQIIIK
jgi:hypothetical protein